MLFGEGKRAFTQLYATHPPLVARIQALEPGFRPEELEQVREQYSTNAPNGMAEDASLGFASAPASSPRSVSVTPQDVSSRVGTFEPDDLVRGAAISRQIPAKLHQLAGQPSTASDLILALMLDADATVRARQVAMTGPAAAQLYEDVADLPELLRLPLIELALPSIATRPGEHVRGLIELTDRLAQADATYSLFEYCALRLMGSYLRDALNPPARSAHGHADTRTVQQAAVTLIAAIAAAGNSDAAAAERAYVSGVSQLLPGGTLPPYNPPPDVLALDSVWAPLDSLRPRYKRQLVEALVAAVHDDGVLTVAEAELLRTACALLHCPLPVLVA
jgi:hypothetical protein